MIALQWLRSLAASWIWTVIEVLPAKECVVSDFIKAFHFNSGCRYPYVYVGQDYCGQCEARQVFSNVVEKYVIDLRSPDILTVRNAENSRPVNLATLWCRCPERVSFQSLRLGEPARVQNICR